LFPVVLQNFGSLSLANQADDLIAVSIEHATLDLSQTARWLDPDCAVVVGFESHSCRSESIQNFCRMRLGYLVSDAGFETQLIATHFGSRFVLASLSISGQSCRPQLRAKRFEFPRVSRAHFL
jgi:hypothetical protein